MEANGSQGTSGSASDSQHDPGKMFMGGLSWQTSPDSLRDYFSKFGEIRECLVMRDPTTKRSRDPASVDKVLGQPHHELDSKTMDPKKERNLLVYIFFLIPQCCKYHQRGYGRIFFLIYRRCKQNFKSEKYKHHCTVTGGKN
uniref:RRM domain-containing protein n=1 Tax=Microcebus murinus TaxID=30608 RepID=A0A8C5XHZ0_MICMU